jgi:hypothetical protein
VAKPDGRRRQRPYVQGMNSKTSTTESAAGDGLMFLIAVAVVGIVFFEAVFVAFASWLLLPLMMLGVIVAAVLVIVALSRVIGNEPSSSRS